MIFKNNKLIQKIWRGWKKIAYFMGHINGHILLIIFYFTFFGVLAVFKKVFKIFQRHHSPTSYWLTKEESAVENFEQQF